MGNAKRVSRGPAGCLGALGVLLLLALIPSSASAGCPNEALRRGPSVALPDCRAYEQVSPVAKGGYDAVRRGIGLEFPAQSSLNGEGVAYMGVGPFSGAVGSVLPDVRVSSRGAASWSTLDSTPPTLAGVPAGGVPAGYDFSEDLSTMAIKIAQDPLVPGMSSGAKGLYNLFLHHPDGTYSLVNSLAPTNFPPGSCEICSRLEDLVAFAGASSNFNHVLFETNDILEGTEASANINLYESSGGSVRLVGVLPDGTIADEGAVPGAGGSGGTFYSSFEGGPNQWGRVDHAISADGSRVVFQAAADGGEPDSAQSGFQEVYDRIEGKETVEISAPSPGAEPSKCETRGGFCEPEAAQFWAASTDGSIVYFASKASLTKESFTGAEESQAERKTKEKEREQKEKETEEPGERSVNPGNDLYSYNVNSGTLKDITVDTNDTSGAEVMGVVNASSDGSYVYFVAKGELVKGKGVDGEPNLYVAHVNPESHAVEVKFIATLVESGDSRDWTSTPAELEAYVSPDGTHLAFMSVGKLTGYENSDQSTGTPDSEVYEYSTGSGALACVSCNPSGLRPTGNSFLGATFQHLVSTPFHQPRVMSDDGSRVFFSSPDELARGASGPHVKIYEHEQNGMGSCAEEGGCVFLISGAASSAYDVFLDASSDGSNVFFSTLSQLVPTDTDNLVDVYDARVGGGFSEAVAPAECAIDCQVPGGSPTSSPLTSGFSGSSGNLAPPAARPVLSKAQKLAKAIRACPKRPKKRRAKCVALAKKRYGAKSRGSRAARRAGVWRRGGHS